MAIKIFGNHASAWHPKKTFKPREKLLAISEENPLRPESACRAMRKRKGESEEIGKPWWARGMEERARRPISRALNTPPRKRGREKRRRMPHEQNLIPTIHPLLISCLLPSGKQGWRLFAVDARGTNPCPPFALSFHIVFLLSLHGKT